ncbi:anthrone oxygenase family protein [Actinokineospora spheciospongiae]|uniref:anthrone oxygenase family protein n=1 Tax=Actinokineospora spheciospongiae TaxID=909613 RepID=UPI000D70D2DB|nr:DUF1772 domain-containing protein [Actinokineospora spheciospongiae]PWW59493.1 putative membrane protein [Actinokineospora spheciospongiae]
MSDLRNAQFAQQVGPPTGKSKLATPVLWLATACMGLMAGTFFTFANAVMPALAKTDNRTFIDSMQQINRAIQNNTFGSVLAGAFIFTGAAAIIEHKLGKRTAARWVLASLALYVVAIGITMGINIPLNDQLEAAGLPTDLNELARVRGAFEDPWNKWHLVRTIANVLAFGALAGALLSHKRSN